MLKDFRESFEADLRNPEFQREFIAAAYEEEGPEGIVRALGEIASVTQDSLTAPRLTSHARTSRRLAGGPTFKTVRAALNALDLDFAIVRKS